jgi:CRP-like cAMP-binding protein
VKTYKANGDGKELITGIHGQGDFLGYVSLLEEMPCNETATILEEAEIAIIPKQDFISLIYSNKDIPNIVGTATESLNRTLADFKDEGMIDLVSEGIKILNTAKLERAMRL